MTSKNEKFFRISLSIFALDSVKGHLGCKVTELEKKSKVSRTLIYRYFGKNKAEIFKNALEIFLNEFYGFAEKIESARRLLKENRDAVIFYQKWRLTDSPIKDIFIKIEEKFRKKLKKMFPHLSSDEILLVHACMDGAPTLVYRTLFLKNKIKTFSQNTSGSKTAVKSLGIGNSIFKDNTIEDLERVPFFTSFSGNLFSVGASEAESELMADDKTNINFELVAPNVGDAHTQKTFFFEPFQFIPENWSELSGNKGVCSMIGFWQGNNPLIAAQNLFSVCTPGPRPSRYFRGL